MLNYNRSLQSALAAYDDFLGYESDAELAAERRARDDRDLSPFIGVLVTVGLSLPFWCLLIWVLL